MARRGCHIHPRTSSSYLLIQALARPITAPLPKKQLLRVADAVDRRPFDKVVQADFKALVSKSVGVLRMELERAAMATGAVQIHNAKLVASATEDVRMRIGAAVQMRGLIDADARWEPTGYDLAFPEKSVVDKVGLNNEHLIEGGEVGNLMEFHGLII